MSRKSIAPTEMVQEKTQLYIVKEEKPIEVDSFLPNFTFSYENEEIDPEAMAMIKSLNTFIRENEEVVLMDYSSKDIKAVAEGFQRAIAIVELFLKSLYIDQEANSTNGSTKIQ